MSIGLPKDVWISIIVPCGLYDLLSLHRVNQFFRHLIDNDQNFFLRHIEFRYTYRTNWFEAKADLRWLAWSDLQKDIYCRKNYPSVWGWLLDRPFYEPDYQAFKCLVTTGNVKDARRLLEHPKTNVSHHWIDILTDCEALELLVPLLSLGISRLTNWDIVLLVSDCWDAGVFDVIDMIFDDYISDLERFERIFNPIRDRRYNKFKDYYIERTQLRVVTKRRKIAQEN